MESKNNNTTNTTTKSKVISKNKKRVLTLLVVIIFIIAIIGIYFIFRKPIPKDIVYKNYTIINGGKGEILDYDQSIISKGFEDEDKAYYITGEIRNDDSENEYKYITINFTLYDKDDNVLGIAQAAIQKMGQNETKSFKAYAPISLNEAEKIDHYELTSIKPTIDDIK